jgi:quercetin dioxygenase-like cupin family protein
MIIRHANTEHQSPGKRSQFTGEVIGDLVLPSTDGVVINTVTFAPGARTYWHSHDRGQILVVLTGYGLICSEGEPPAPLRPGDWVWVPAGERHWHGAAPGTFMTHTAISLGPTSWSDEVTQDEYTATPHQHEGEPE